MGIFGRKSEPVLGLAAPQECTSEFVTQYGTDYFKSEPSDGQRDLSMFCGVGTADELYRGMRGRPAPDAGTVRYFRVSTLRDNGYLVADSPSPSNPRHVSVFYDTIPGDPQAAKLLWAKEGRTSLDDLALHDVADTTGGETSESA